MALTIPTLGVHTYSSWPVSTFQVCNEELDIVLLSGLPTLITRNFPSWLNESASIQALYSREGYCSPTCMSHKTTLVASRTARCLPLGLYFMPVTLSGNFKTPNSCIWSILSSVMGFKAYSGYAPKAIVGATSITGYYTLDRLYPKRRFKAYRSRRIHFFNKLFYCATTV